MLLSPILLDADMTASEVLKRLAANGFWLDRGAPAARERIEALSKTQRRDFDSISISLERDPRRSGAAIRRQWGTYVLWYARGLEEILALCTNTLKAKRLSDVLDLHESNSDAAIEFKESLQLPAGRLILMESGLPVAVILENDHALNPPPPHCPIDLGPSRGGNDHRPPMHSRYFRDDITVFSASEEANIDLEDDLQFGPLNSSPDIPVVVWPRIEAPDWVPAGRIFEVAIGFASARQTGVAGGELMLPFTSDSPFLDLTIELSAGSGVDIDPLNGWRRNMRVRADDVESAVIHFHLIGAEPANLQRACLTTLEVRYVLNGTVCGIASRPIAILPAGSAGPDTRPYGIAWAAPPTSSPMALIVDENAPDLTLEISKPDGNAASGRYQCRLLSPHPLLAALGPFDIDLGQDARTYARALVDEVRLYAGDPLLGATLEGIGRLVAQKLPEQFFVALAELRNRIGIRAPAVLIVSTEHYVPWELAWVEARLDDSRPHFLGAQAMVGRWLRDRTAMSSATAAAPRPAVHPLGTIEVKQMAVMAAWYKQTSGMRRLPKAEAEACALVATYSGIQLPARSEQLRDLLGANLRNGPDPAQVQAVHFAGHGTYDPTVPDSSAMYLENGKPLRSTLFRAAKYGGERQPLLFLNACMLGIGGELLGDMAGFPGNSLRGGFGGVLGALWEIDDEVAHDIAIEFWERALPSVPASGEPIGSILRDLRARYLVDSEPAPIATYLAYVYYGHPRLTLQRVALSTPKVPP